MTDARIAQVDVSVLESSPASARIAEVSVSVLGQPPTQAFIAQSDVSMLAQPPTGAIIAAVDVSVLCYMAPCYTRRCQILTITRRDGVVKRFTALDKPVTYLAETYEPCASFQPSASESASDLGSVGNIELDIIINSEAISADEITAGLYDDAFWEVMEIAWDDPDGDPQTPFRVAAGWSGNVSQGETGFKCEIVGPGARINQTPLVDVVSPSCRLAFGSAECGVDADALKISGAVVSSTLGRGTMFSPIVNPDSSPATRIWNGGTVEFLTGRNAGARCEVDTVDFATGKIVLWKIAPFKPAAGDTFDLKPGCPKDAASCKLYSNYVNFGGFKDVPGNDAASALAPVK